MILTTKNSSLAGFSQQNISFFVRIIPNKIKILVLAMEMK